MRVQHELLEIDLNALRFETDETAALIDELGGVHLDPDDIDELTRSTDGWVTALQLASLSLRGHDDPAELMGHISGRHRGIAEFLTQNVLDVCEPEMLEFLLATSVTDQICGELAAVLAEVERGHAVLEQAEERDLFLTRVDEEASGSAITTSCPTTRSSQARACNCRRRGRTSCCNAPPEPRRPRHARGPR